MLMGVPSSPFLVLSLSFLCYAVVQLANFRAAYPEDTSGISIPLPGNSIYGGAPSAGAADALVASERLLLLAAIGIRRNASWSSELNHSRIWDEFPGLLSKELWRNKNNCRPFGCAVFATVVLVAAIISQTPFFTVAAAKPVILCGQQSLEYSGLGILLSASVISYVGYRSSIDTARP